MRVHHPNATTHLRFTPIIQLSQGHNNISNSATKTQITDIIRTSTHTINRIPKIQICHNTKVSICDNHPATCATKGVDPTILDTMKMISPHKMTMILDITPDTMATIMVTVIMVTASTIAVGQTTTTRISHPGSTA